MKRIAKSSRTGKTGLSRRGLLGAAALAAACGPAMAASDFDDNYADDARVFPRPPMAKSKPFSLAIQKPETVGMSAAGLGRITAYIQDKIDNNVISGAVTAIARRGELVQYQAQGYFNAATKKPLPKDAIYRMASSTKPITATALMMMVEEGRVALHDPVSQYIPDFKEMKVAVLRPGQPGGRRPAGSPPRQIDLVPANRPITIVDLCTHTSGLKSNGPGTENANLRLEANDTLATYIPRLAKAPLDFQPGTQWAYSAPNGGPDTLGHIVELMSGMDLDTFFRERIFKPLGMNDTHFNLPPEKESRRLPQQRFTDGKWVVDSTPVPHTGFFSGGGGLWSTCHDYLLFEQMLLNRGELNGKRLLGSRTVELMGTNLIGNLYKGPSNDQPGHGFGVLMRIVLDSSKSDTGRSNGAFGWDGAGGTMSWQDKAEDLAAVIMLEQRDFHGTMFGFEREVRQAISD